MKIFRIAAAGMIAVICTSCIPGKFASRLEGTVVDSNSVPLPGARLDSKIPHREAPVGGFAFTDQKGEFDLPPEYGVFKLLTMDADWREVIISKDGYESKKVSVMEARSERFITYDDREDYTTMSPDEPLRITLKKKPRG
jgi:hypothetical protein